MALARNRLLPSGAWSSTDTSAIVTGGASGLGAATARALAAEGVRVTVFDRNEDGAKAVADEIGGDDVAGDVTDAGRLPAGGRPGRRSAATLRIAVNCAGTGWIGRVINRDGSPHDLGAFEFIQQLNVIGTFNVMTKAASAIAETEPERGRRAGRDRQHRLGRRLRRADRPARLLGLEGGRSSA